MNKLKLVTQDSYAETAENYTPIVTIYAGSSRMQQDEYHEPSTGCGAVIIDRNRAELKLVAKYLGPHSYQQAEILACVKALEELRRPCLIEIFANSYDVIDTMNGKKPMTTDLDFWPKLVEASYGHHIGWYSSKGCDGVIYQEAANRLARASAIAETDLFVGDLNLLTEKLSRRANQIDISWLEIELDKIVSRYAVFTDTTSQMPKLGYMAGLPSAFSASTIADVSPRV